MFAKHGNQPGALIRQLLRLKAQDFAQERQAGLAPGLDAQPHEQPFHQGLRGLRPVFFSLGFRLDKRDREGFSLIDKARAGRIERGHGIEAGAFHREAFCQDADNSF